MTDYDNTKPGQVAAYLVNPRTDYRDRVRAALPFIPMSPELREVISDNIDNMPEEVAEEALKNCAESVYKHGKAAINALERELSKK